MARNFKRDRKGRFAKVAGMKGSNPRSVKPAGTNKSRVVSSHKMARNAINSKRKPPSRATKNVRRAAAAYSVVRLGAAAAAGYSVYTASTLGERRERSTMNMRQAADSLTRGLPSMIIPKRSRRGVYNITTL